MNFENLIHDSSFNNDYQRLIKLCGSYGLNEEETNQIISDFKNGSFAQHDQSIDQSFHQSIQNHQYSQQHDESSRNHDQYSFKYQKNKKNVTNHLNIISQNDSLEQESSNNTKKQQNKNISQGYFELFMAQRKEFQKNIYSKLQLENQRLKKQLEDKSEQIQFLIKLKAQDSEIIIGLQEAINNLTTIVQEKDHTHRVLSDKYEKLKSETETVSSQKNSKVQISHQQSISSLEERKSIVKENCPTQNQIKNNVCKKPSQKYIKQISNRVPSKSNFQKPQHNQENRENVMRNDQIKRSGIDIGKYKGMIQKLRNSYEFR